MAHPANEQPSQFSLTVDADDNASRAVLGEARRLFDFDDDDTASGLLTALSEIVQNAVNAHTDAAVERVIEITFTGDPTGARIVDFGQGFDWQGTLDTTSEPTSTHGRGLHIASAFVPDMTITSGNSGTSVNLPFGGSRWSHR